MKNHRFFLIIGLLIGLSIIMPIVSALPAGFQEFYLPLQTNITQDSFTYVNRAALEEAMTYVVGVTASADNTVVYYDHWENGLKNGTDADEVVRLSKGEVKVFRSNNIPTNPRGTGTYYDGGDRIFVSGSLLQLVVSTWPSTTGTVLSDAWEVYPVKAWNTQYVVPVGEDIGATANYIDFAKTTIQVMSGTNGNSITFTPPSGTPTAPVTLNRGQALSYTVAKAGTTVSATSPIQVQIIAGDNANSRWSMRGYTITPRQYWGTSYYAPVPSWSNAKSDLFLYNPNSATITVNYETRTGSSSFTIAAGKTRSFFEATGAYIPQNSGVYLSSASVFWGIASCDTKSPTWDWAYSLVPATMLGTDNYVSWAPGTSETPPKNNGSPVYITATTNGTTVYAYYSPDDGVPDRTFTLDRLQSVEIYDTDNDNSGMHIVSTAPVAMAWGESPTKAGTGSPYLDMGYTTLPLPIEWIDVALNIEKTAEPTQIRVGGESTFTLNISVPGTAGAPITNPSVVDKLPPGWEYVAGSTKLDGISYPNPTTITGSLTGGYTLTWNGTGTLAPNTNRNISFRALSTSSVNSNYPNRNVASATGESLGATLTADSDAFVTFDNSLPGIKITKSGPASARIGEEIRYTFNVTNTGNLSLSNVTVNDPMLGGNFTETPSGDVGNDRVLNASEVWQYTRNYTVKASDPNPLVNTATVTADYKGISTSDVDDHAVTLNIAPGINLDKSGPVSARVGEEITYTFNVTNTGNVPLSNVTVNDLMLGGKITGLVSGDVNNDQILNLTEVWQYTKNYTVKAGDPDPLINNATATGDYLGIPTNDSDEHSVPLNIAPEINLAKTGPASAQIGEEITYRFNVTNMGNVPLSNVTVNDPMLGGTITGPISGDVDNDGVLNLTEVWQYTRNYTVKTGDPNPLVNNATATGDYQGKSVTDSDPFTIPLDIAPGINLDKSGPRSANISEVITYTFNVTNTGNVPLSNVTVIDPLPGLSTITGPTGDNGDNILNTSEVWQYTAIYTVRENDPDPLVNNATATGDYRGVSVNNTDSSSVPFDLAPGINLAKTGPASARIGEEITYTFIVTNTGNTPLSSVTVNDPMLGGTIAGPASGDDGNDGILTLNEVWQYTRNYTVKAGDPNPLINNATATGSFKGQSVSDSDPYTLTLDIAPGINLDKSGPRSANISEAITYTFTVTNTGNVPLSNVTVNDPLPGIFAITGPTGDESSDLILKPGEVWQYTATYTIPTGAPNPVVNTATATGDFQGESVTHSDQDAVPLNLAPGINLAKTGPASARIGEEITYTFTVTNSGNLPLSNVTVNDPMLDGTITGPASGDVNNDGVLNLTEVWKYTKNYTVKAGDPNPLVNTATATGDYQGEPATDSDQYTLKLDIAPGINLDKSGPSSAQIGEEIIYTFTVTNSGNVPLSNVSINDPLPGLSTITGPTGDNGDNILNLTEVWQYTTTYTVKENDPNPLVNNATAKGDYQGEAVTDSDPFTIPLDIAPGIKLDKSGPASARIGEEITYTFTVMNSGNVPLSNITVSDPMLGGNITGPASGDNGDHILNTSEAWVYTANYTVKENDPNPLVNTATAKGDYQGNSTDTDSFTVILNTAPGINLAKSGPKSAAIGQEITYTFNVTNTGNVPLSSVTVNDPMLGGILSGPASGDDGDNILNLTEVWQYTKNYTVKENDPNPLLNTATATGSYKGESVEDTDPYTLTLDLAPEIKIVKSGPASAQLGENITYTFTVTNTGNAPLSNITVSDPMLGVTLTKPASGDVGSDDVLNLTEVWVYTARYTVPAGAPNPLINTATATGAYQDTHVTDTSHNTMDLNLVRGINLNKSGPASALIGEEITYTFTVMNTGNVPLSNITVSDPMLGGTIAGPASGDNGDHILNTSEVWQYTANYTVKENDPNPLVNTATAKGDYQGNSTDTDSFAVILNTAPGIKLAKSGPKSAAVGQEITYTFNVTNTGNLPLSNVIVKDPMLGGTIAGPASGDNGDHILNTSEVWQYTKNYTIKADDPNPLINTATAMGDYRGQSVEDSDPYSMTLNPPPGIRIVKSGPESAQLGEIITYTFTVTNTGNAPLSSVTVSDPLPGLSTIIGPTGDNGDHILNTSEVWQYTANYTVPTGAPNPLVNNATATGDYQGTHVTDTDNYTVNLNLAPAINLTKGGPSTAEIGGVISYTFIVRNPGNVPLSNVKVNDPLLGGIVAGPASGDIGNDGILNLGEVWQYTATYRVPVGAPNPLVNTASVTGDYGTTDYTDNAQHSTPITNPVPTTIPTTNVTTAQTTVPTTNATTIPTTNATTIPTTNATTTPTTNATTIPTTNATTIPTTNTTTIPTTNATTIPTTNTTTIPTTNATTIPTTTKTPVPTTVTTATTTVTTTKTPVPTTVTTATTTVTTTKTPVPTTVTTIPKTTTPTTVTTTKTAVPTTVTTIPKTAAPTTAVPTTEPTFIDVRPGTTTPTTAVPTTVVPTTVKPTTAVPTTVTPTPTVISQPGSYQIDRDVRNTTTPIWIIVTVSNVTIDGRGHTIDGTDADGSYGILVRGDGLLSNITITNVTITDFAYGIGLYNVTNSRIIGVNTSSNTYDGIIIVGGGNNTLADNIIHQDDDGIYLKGTNMTLVTNNTITENLRGSGIHLSDNCDQVDLINNTIRGNDEGIEIEEASNSTIRTNWITTSRYFGLNLTTALNLTVADNYINNSVNVIAQNGIQTGVWNLPATAGTNVIGNTYTGGNYWGTPNGTGFSDTAADMDGDGFTNGIYQIPGGIGTDRLPLSPTSYLLNGADRPFPVPVNSSLEAPLTSGVTAKPDPWAGLRKLYPIGGLFRL